MVTGLTFDEYIELTAMPMAAANPVFVQAVEEGAGTDVPDEAVRRGEPLSFAGITGD